ncbi:hypothetical protein BaRGS_00007093 [Batillaria attramentaria]|uniref:Uncharacterized protein n=1 Tax=Batillaria attramentaria TaxID=370345 RepID=A0ABD0LQD2_9CAEN
MLCTSALPPTGTLMSMVYGIGLFTSKIQFPVLEIPLGHAETCCVTGSEKSGPGANRKASIGEVVSGDYLSLSLGTHSGQRGRLKHQNTPVLKSHRQSRPLSFSSTSFGAMECNTRSDKV